MSTDRSPSGFPQWLLLLVTAVLGGSFVIGSQQPTAPADASKTGPAETGAEKREPPPAPASDNERPDRGPLSVLYDYFAVFPPRSPEHEFLGKYPPWLADKRAALKRWQTSLPAAGSTAVILPARDLPALLGSARLLAENPTLEFLVATVHDPVDSRFLPHFDQGLEAIKRAFQTQGLLLNRAWLPWPGQRSATELAQEAARENVWRRLPGTLLFRGRDRLVLVFLVGDTPIAGVHKPAFFQALRYIEAMYPEAFADPIRVVGPCFSGSQESLAQVLDEWGRRQVGGYTPRFRVLSGCATAIEPQSFNTPGRTFQATTVPSSLLRSALLRHLAYGPSRADAVVESLDRMGSDELEALFDRLGNVALLQEANTGFGLRLGPTGQSGSDCAAPDSDALDCPLSDAERQAKEDAKRRTDILNKRLIYLPFPIAVSQLWPKIDERRRRIEEQKGLVPARDSLIPSLRPFADTQLDGIPLRAPEADAVVTARAITDLLDTVRREQVRYVGITASDTRDVVFLSAMLHERCPDVQVFTALPDVFLTVPQEAYHLRGLVVGSTYPLHLPNQHWTDPTEQTYQPFMGTFSEGTFNAVLLQIGGEEKLAEYWPPHLGRREPARLRPPIWIARVGQNGSLVPLCYYTNYNDSSPLVALQVAVGLPGAALVPGQYVLEVSHNAAGEIGADRQLPVKPSPSLWLLAVCVLAPITAFVVALGRGRLSGQLLFWRDPPVPPGKPPRPPGREERSARAVCLLSLLALTAPLALVWWNYSSLSEGLPRVCYLSVACLLSAAGLGVAYHLIVWTTPRPWKAHWSAIATGTTVTLFLLCFAWAYRPPSPAEAPLRALFLYRVGDFTTGLSPLMPLLLVAAALFTFGYYRLKRFELYRRYAIHSPFAPAEPEHAEAKPAESEPEGAETDPFRRVVSQGRWLERYCAETSTWPVCGPRGDWRWSPALVALAALVVTLGFALRARLTLEGPLWDALFVAGFGLGLTFAVIVLLRLWTFCSELKKLLHEIALIPMMRAFDRLPDKVSALFGGYLNALRPRLSHLGVPLQQLSRLRDMEPPATWSDVRDRLRCNLPARYEGVSDQTRLFDRTPDLAAGDQWEREEMTRRRLWDELSGFSHECLERLRTHWPSREAQAAFGSSHPETDSAAKKEPAGDRVFLVEAGSANGNGVSQPASVDGGTATVAMRKEVRPAAATAPAAGQPDEVAWVDAVEALVATQVIVYLTPFFKVLRCQALTLTIAVPLLLLGASWYPFQGEAGLVNVLMAILIASVIAILQVLVTINRDELVSRIQRTTPNRLTFDGGFLNASATFILPLVAIAAGQLSGVFHWLVDPILGVLR